MVRTNYDYFTYGTYYMGGLIMENIFKDTVAGKKDMGVVQNEKDEKIMALKDLNNDQLRARLDF